MTSSALRTPNIHRLSKWNQTRKNAPRSSSSYCSLRCPLPVQELIIRKTLAQSQRKVRRLSWRVASFLVSCITLIWIATSGENRSAQHLGRLLPRTQREFRRHFLNDWRYALNKAQGRPKYHVGDVHFQVFVISLERMPERKRETVRALEIQGIQWTTHQAVDGLDDLDMVTVTKYAGYKKRKRLAVTTGIGPAQLVSLKRDYDNSERVPTHLRISLHERLRFGCYMSHVLLWQKLLQMDMPHAVVLEDDAVITDKFSDELNARLRKLPDNWDILFLNGCYKKFGYVFDDGVRQSRGGLCTFAYTISLKGARYLLQSAVVRSEKPIDHVLDYETLTGRLISFHADPPLAYTSSHALMSTLAY